MNAMQQMISNNVKPKYQAPVADTLHVEWPPVEAYDPFADKASAPWPTPTPLTAHTSGALRQKMHERFDLFPIEGLQAYSRVAEFGAKKYAPWNWAKGLPRMQIAASLIRHLWAYMRGEDNDPESDLSHADHVLWNAVALVYHHDRGMEDDRRPAQGEVN